MMTALATPNPMSVANTAPTHTASAPPHTSDHTRRHQGAGRYSDAGTSSKRGRSGVNSAVRPSRRDESARALAGLRHPVAKRATTARPASQPAAVVTSVTLTQHDMVDEPSGAAPSLVVDPPRRHLRWAVPLAVLGGLLLLTPLAAAVTPAKWFVDKERCTELDDSGACTTSVVEPAEFALVPANAEPVASLLSVTGAEEFDSTDDIFFVTIREPRITILDWMAVRVNPAARLRSNFDKYGGEPEGSLRERGQRQMTGAKEWAVFVALTRAGYEPTFVPGPAVVDYVLCITPSDDGTECDEYPPSKGLIESNDVIVKADGTEIEVLPDLSEVIGDREPGDMIELVLLRDGKEITGTVELIAAPDEPERAIIGFMPIDTTTLEMPEGVEVEFDTGNIGGPSAGLAFTLSLLDRLTEGDLTGGVRVAVTGTINVDGTVGAIGGLSSKASAVAQVGVQYFLVPATQAAEGSDSIEGAQRAAGPGVTIIPVATLEEALEVLAELGGDPLPPLPAD